MKIAIPLANGKLSMHFGHCERFAIVDVDDDTQQITQKQEISPPSHEPGALPALLHQQGVHIIIAGGMGQRAQQIFVQNDIQVVVGAASLTPEELVKAYLDGTLQTGANICDH